MKAFVFIALIGVAYGCNSSSDINESSNEVMVDDSAKTNNLEIASSNEKHVSNKNYQEYYPGGQLKIEGNYNNQSQRNGLWVSYYENGSKWSETTYSNGKKNGHSITFFPNGKIRYIGEYSNDEKSGEWKFYDESGNLIETESY